MAKSNTADELKRMQMESRKRTEAILGAWTEKPTGMTKALLDNYRESYKDITGQLESVYAKLLSGVKPEDYYNVMFQRNRLESLLKQTADAYKKGAKGAAKDLFNMSETAFSNSYYNNMYSVNWFTDPYFTVLDTKAVEVAVYGTDDIWKSIKKSNRASYENYLPRYGTLSEILDKNATLDIAKLKQAITSGIRTGKSYTKVAKDIQNVLNTTASNAMRIARTEGNRALNSGAYANTQAALDAGIELKRMYVATQDTRTRSQSASMDGQTVPADKPFVYGGLEWFIPGNSGNPAYDIHDRCTTVDIVVDEVQKEGTPSYSGMSDWMSENGLIYDGAGRMVDSGVAKKVK